LSREWERVDQAEREIIEPFLQEIPVKVAGIARALGIEVKAATLKPRISGQIGPSETSDSGYRIRVNRHEAMARQRFTIAHEIAHFLLHRDQIGDGLEDTIRYRSTSSDTREAEAKRLAADLIMPRFSVRRRLSELGKGATPEVASQLAEEYHVSEAAMNIRLGIS